MELAALQRYEDAHALRLSGRYGAAVYLVGYTTEMFLKCAYFRAIGAQGTDRVVPMLDPARRAAHVLCPQISPEHYHNLLFWGTLLRRRRRGRNPMPHELDSQLAQRVRRVHQLWWIEMRYRQDLASARDARVAMDDALWLRENYASLWR
jgi:hypothetical protein